MDFPVEARDELFAREELLIGKKGLDVLAGSCVAVFGLGGVGGNCAEALARAGVGRLILVDNDSFCLSRPSTRSAGAKRQRRRNESRR